MRKCLDESPFKQSLLEKQSREASWKFDGSKCLDGVLFSVSCKKIWGWDENKNTHLLQIENVVVEIILQLFICIVDAELLKAVGLKVLKAKNIQDTNGQALENKNFKPSHHNNTFSI